MYFERLQWDWQAPMVGLILAFCDYASRLWWPIVKGMLLTSPNSTWYWHYIISRNENIKVITLHNSWVVFHETNYHMNIILFQFWDSPSKGSTHIVYYEFFWHASINYQSILIATSFFGKNPSCNHLVVLWKNDTSTKLEPFPIPQHNQCMLYNVSYGGATRQWYAVCNAPNDKFQIGKC